MKLHFLEASVPLTKSYEKRADGTINKTSYPHVYEVTSHDEEVNSLTEFEKALRYHAGKQRCLLKGLLSRSLVKESRAGTTDTNESTEWVVFDLDGLHHGATPDSFLKSIGLQDFSYIVQYSASYGIENTDLRAHVFMLLDKPYAAPLLKQWLVGLNHDTPTLSQGMSLTKTGNAISWPLDISACQNDKLIYIAPPILRNIKDPVPKGQRIQFIKKKKDRLTISQVIPSSAKNRERTIKRIDELRDADGLPKRKTTFKMHGSTEVLVKPDVCTVTETKTERGFVYFNLNGGDSWAYYHPENNPDYIYNFKGEPAYLTKELLPEYWQQITSSASRVSSSGELYLAFCDRKTGTYWRGTYDPATDYLDINQAKNETQVRHFAKQYGVPLGDYIPEWDLVFDPQSLTRVDVKAHVVNTFERTEYMKATPTKVKKIPPNVHKVIWHVIGEDQALYEHFLNWLACIIQFRCMTRTAWVLHGTTGTGKGVLMNKILRPILGMKQTTMRRMEEFNEQYNHFMKSCLLVFVDEVQTKALQNEQGVMAKMKNFITEPVVTIRAMHAGGVECDNFTNWILASNKSDPVLIDVEDRRFNVGKYQSTKLRTKLADDDLPLLETELQAFHDFMVNYPANLKRAGEICDSTDRQTMISISESSIDTVVRHLLDGHYEFFIDQLPTSMTYQGNAAEINRVNDYKQVLSTLLARADRNTGKCNISREELRTVFEYVVGGMPSTPNKFTSLVKHHRLHMGKVWLPGGTVNGVQVVWKDTTQWTEFEKRLAPPQFSQPSKKISRVK